MTITKRFDLPAKSKTLSVRHSPTKSSDVTPPFFCESRLKEGIPNGRRPITLANSANLPRVGDHFSIMRLNGLNVLLAQAPAPTPAQPQPPALLQFAPFILLLIILYVLFYRGPQQARKKQDRLIQSLKSGDKVVTSSGIVGVVITVKEKTISLRSADAKMEVTKASVSDVLESSNPPAS